MTRRVPCHGCQRPTEPGVRSVRGEPVCADYPACVDRGGVPVDGLLTVLLVTLAAASLLLICWMVIL